jgi:hypothetical protein
MKKIMEVYSAENGLILKSNQRTYHLLGGYTEEEKTDSIRIADTKEAFYFLASFFEDELGVSHVSTAHVDGMHASLEFKLNIKD